MHFDKGKTTNIQGMAHNINGDANFTNGLDKESFIHCDKKMLCMLKITMIQAS